jgi:flagellar hook-length control protein FliK
MDRLDAALGQGTGVPPQSTGAEVQATATGSAAAGQPDESAEAGTNAVPATPDALTILSGKLTTPATDPNSASAAAKPDASGSEPTDARPRASGRCATEPAREGHRAATEPNSGQDDSNPDPVIPATMATASAAPVPAVIVPFAPIMSFASRSDVREPVRAAHNGDTASSAALRDEGPHRTDRGPTHETPRDQASAAPSVELAGGAPSATPKRSPAETMTDLTQAATSAAHDAPSVESVIRAMTEANQPAVGPAGRAAPASQPSAAPSPADIASPAQQVAAPLVALGPGPDHSQRLTVRLDPASLGAVQVRVDRPMDGPARVEITVERPETLSLLLRDQPELQWALDQAGIPSEGRNLVFQIATPDPQARNDTAWPDSRQSGGGQAATGDSGARSEGYGSGGEGGGSGRSRGDGAGGDNSVFRFTPSAAQRRLRDGLDITA